MALDNSFITGMSCVADLLWLALAEERRVATMRISTGECGEELTYAHEVWAVSHCAEGLWMLTSGGRLGRQLVLWSLEERGEIRKFNCPDGAGAGIAVLDGKLWVTHRHNRKLICLDPNSGKVNWVIRTDNETYNPSAYRNELWLIEADPGPLGHWSGSQQGRYYFSRYDPVRERVAERVSVPFVPACMAFDGERFWYSEQGKKSLFSAQLR